MNTLKSLLLLLAAALILLQGCTTAHSLTPPFSGLRGGDRMSIELNSGERVKLVFLDDENGEIIGMDKNDQIQTVAVADIRLVEVRRFDASKTWAAAGMVYFVIVVGHEVGKLAEGGGSIFIR